MVAIAVGVVGAAVASSATAAIAGAVGSTVVAGVIVAGIQAAATAAAGMVDAELMGQRADRVNIQGPRLSELTTERGSYGAPLPALYGTNKVGGAIIWSQDLKETPDTQTTSGGKKKASGGGQSITRYSYSLSRAYALSSRPISSVTKIWFGGKLLWELGAEAEAQASIPAEGEMRDTNGDGVPDTRFFSWDLQPQLQAAGVSYVYAEDGTPVSMTITGTAAKRITIYFGTEHQTEDPLMVAIDGDENTPAYIGTAYMVVEELQLADYGNAPQAMTCLCSSSEASPTWKALKTSPAAVSPRGTDGAVPVRINFGGRLWATFGLDADGRVSGATYRLNRRRTSAEKVDDIVGPMAAGTDVRRLDALVDPSGRYVAVLLRGAGDPHPSGWIQLCIYDIWRRAMLGSAVQAVPGLNDLGGDEPCWTGDIIATPSSYLVGQGHRAMWGWRVTPSGAVSPGIQYYLPLGHGSLVGYVAHSAVVAVNPDLKKSFFLSTFTGSSTGVARVTPMGEAGPAAAFGPILFPGRTLGGITSRGRVERLPSGEWLVISEGQGQGAGGWIATINADGTQVTRPPFDVDGAEGLPVGRLSIAYLRSRGRIAVFGFQAVDTARYGEITMTADGFTVSRTTSALGGEAVPGADQSGFRSYYVEAATPGVLLAWPAHAGVVQPIVAYDPEPDIAVADIMDDLCEQAGYDLEDYDFSDIDVRCRGFSVPRPMAARGCLEQLNTYSDADTHVSDGRLKGIPRTSTPTVVIPDEMTGILDSDGGPGRPARQLTRPADLDLPRALSLIYVDQDVEYEAGAQASARMDDATGSAAEVSVELAVVMSAGRARGIAFERLFAQFNEREKIEGSLPSDYVWLDPGDVISYRGMTLRIQSLRITGNGIEFTAVRASTMRPHLELEVDDPPPAPLAKPPVLPSDLYMLDIPLLVPEQDSPSIVAAAVYPGSQARFPGAAIARGYDPQVLQVGATARTSAVVGVVENVVRAGPTRYWDEVSHIDVVMPEEDAARLETVTQGDILNGRNVAALGSEILQFRKVEPLGVGRVRLSDLLRGRRGTERFVGTHQAGDTFILLGAESPADPVAPVVVPLELPSRNKAMFLAATTVGLDPERTPRQAVVPRLESLTPIAPCHLRGTRTETGDLAVSWRRRSRTEARWLDWRGTPLGEEVEAYRVQVLDEAGQVVRTAQVPAASAWTYTAAQQTADFGAPQAALRVAVSQFSLRVGWGHAATGEL